MIHVIDANELDGLEWVAREPGAKGEHKLKAVYCWCTNKDKYVFRVFESKNFVRFVFTFFLRVCVCGRGKVFTYILNNKY